ncbi:protein PRY1-like isoform X2 [Actinia tenebrosa]|uniref:Protein PRY1-like isoform X2 n=1 Tax=Actinia tenebrosa TaxID=6105 RepID=A0A6P8IK48_ACTTE|nr:protein PRY1-like isoform X2 [Actinia tenebrosa]
MLFIIIVNLFLSFFSFASCQDGFDTNCLDAHNEYRKKHGSPPLKWSASLAADAQKWADQLAKEDKFEHDMKSVTSKNQGENLAYFSPPKKKCMGAKKDDCVQCSEMVADWYNEVNDYDFNTGKAKAGGKVYLHFTQVVWKASVELGVGVGISQTYGFITVARYSPRGNMGSAEDFKKNVLPEGAVPSSGPGTTPPTTPSMTKTPSGATGGMTSSTPAGTTLSTTSSTIPSTSSSKKLGSSNCEYLIITTVTKQQKIIQKCNGKPNVTFVPLSTAVGVPHPPTSRSTSRLPTTAPAPNATSSTNSPNTVQTNATTALESTASPTKIPTGGSTGPTTPTQSVASSGSTTLTPTGGTKGPSATSSGSTTLTPTGPTVSTTGPTIPSQKPNKVDKDQHDKSLMLINLYRAMHGSAPLFWNEQLANESQAWAEKLAQKGTLDHDTSMTDGENIAKLPASNSDVMNAIDAWYEEEKMFDYKNPAFSKATGHFTQLVWKGSKEMGLGIAPSKDNSEYYIVARFRPSGNVQGKFAVNVGPKVLM